MKVESTCLVCNSKFHKLHSAKGKFCSLKCNGLYRKKKYEKKCLVCNALFMTKPSDDKKYCSTKCYREKPTRKVTKNCPVCEKQFDTVYNCTFCSPKCKGISTRIQVDICCPVCDVIFKSRGRTQVAKHCSTKCSAIAQTNLWKQEKYSKAILTSLLINPDDIPASELSDADIETIFNLSHLDVDDDIMGIAYFKKACR